RTFPVRFNQGTHHLPAQITQCFLPVSAAHQLSRGSHTENEGVRGQSIPIRPRRNVHSLPSPASGREELTHQLASRLVGQAHAIAEIVPYVQMHRAGLGPEGRPAGVFLLLGPTGTGKTRTVEALADALHGSEKSLVRVDCGEFQMEHEVAK